MRYAAVLMLVVPLCHTTSAHADKPATPTSRAEIVANGKFVLVVLVNPAFETEQGKAIRAKYPQAGLYKNDGSKEPLWTIDWYREKVTILDDGIHMIRHGHWPTQKGGLKPKDLKKEAVTFYANGKLLREVAIGEVVDDATKLHVSVSHFRWLKDSQVLEAAKQFELTTLDGNQIRFDLTTGKTLHKKKAN